MKDRTEHVKFVIKVLPRLAVHLKAHMSIVHKEMRAYICNVL